MIFENNAIGKIVYNSIVLLLCFSVAVYVSYTLFWIPAAHCLDYGGEYGKLVKTDDLKVSVGSPFRDWSIEPQEVQRRNVSACRIGTWEIH